MNMKKTPREWKDQYETTQFEEECCDKDAALGMKCTKEGSIFRLWSPAAKQVQICFYREGEGGEAYEAHKMNRLEKGVWEFASADSLHGVYYDFLLVIEGETVQSADPYARACGVNGKRSMAVDLKKTDPEGWAADKAPEKEPEQVIYELHVKEFSWDASGGFPEEKRGKYQAFCYADTTLNGEGKIPSGLGYLRTLGVNYIQFMPVYDYGSVDESGSKDAFNWGYDPVNYNVPEGSYSSDPFHGEVRIREFKEAVQSLHRQGFRVIMDVVYNHIYSLDSWLQRTMPWYYYRMWEDGSISDGSACGNDVASEYSMCTKYILDSVLYWAEEYHIDGFRFDLMGLLDVDLMNQIRKELDLRYGKGEKIVFGEPWRAEKTAMRQGAFPADKEHIGLLDEQIGMFSDDTRDVIKGSVFEAEEFGFVNGGEDLEEEVLHAVRAWCGDERYNVKAPSQVVNYVSCHDNYTLWDKLSKTTEDEELRRQQYRLAAGIYMTCQGNLFFLSGEECARTKGGRDNTYNAPIALNKLDWNKICEEKELVEYYRGLIALRKLLPGLCDKSAEARHRIKNMWKRPGCVGFTVDNRATEKAGNSKTVVENVDFKVSGNRMFKQQKYWEKLCIIYNANRNQEEIELPDSRWEILADGDNSFLWKNPQKAEIVMKVNPVSILILGQRRRQDAERITK